MGKPHKHADLIKAWADGAEIEFFSEYRQRWIATDGAMWAENTKYRIKPEPSVLRYRVALLWSALPPHGLAEVVAAMNEAHMSMIERSSRFVRWLPDAEPVELTADDPPVQKCS
jgi:propanediol dehydratase large subunit